jgi:ribosomal protein S18 acetylase RimI-like enzyme
MSNARGAQSTPTGLIIKELSTFTSKERPVVASKIAKLEKKVFPAIEHWNYDVELKKKNIGVILAFKEDDTATMVAYLVYQRMKRLAWLHKLCVIEQEREKGLGKALIHSLRRHMETGGCHTIILWVDENRQPARALYKSCGFQQTECRPDYYGPGRTALKLEMSIGQ